MARQQTIDLNQSFVPQGSNLPEVTPNVVASPVALGVSDEGLRKADQLARDMAAFTGSFERFSQQQSQEVIRTEHEQAVQDAMKDPTAKPVFTQEQSAFYQQARIRMFAETSKNQAAGGLAAYVQDLKDNPEKLEGRTPEQAIQEWYQQNIAGIDDPDVAAVVYPEISKLIPRAQAELAQTRRDYEKKQQFSKAETMVNSLFETRDEQGNVIPRKPAASELWATMKAGVSSGVPRDYMAQLVVERINSEVNINGNFELTDLLRSTSPDGVSFLNTPEDKYRFKERAGQLVQLTATKRAQAEFEQQRAEAEANAAQWKEFSETSLYNAEQGAELPPDQIEKLKGSSKGRLFLLDYEKKLAEGRNKRAEQAGDNAVLTAAAQADLGADNFEPGSEDWKTISKAKKNAWRNQLNAGLVSMNKMAQAAPKTEEGAKQVFEAAGPGTLRDAFLNVLSDRATKNTSVDFKFMQNLVNGVENTTTLSESGGILDQRAVLAMTLYSTMKGSPAYEQFIPEVFTPQTAAFLESWHMMTKAQNGPGYLVSFDQARKAWMDPATRELTQSIEKEAYQTRDKIAKELIGSFSGYFDAVDPEQAGLVIQGLLTESTMKAAAMNSSGNPAVFKETLKSMVRQKVVVRDNVFYKDWNWGRNSLVVLPSDAMVAHLKSVGIDFSDSPTNKSIGRGYTREMQAEAMQFAQAKVHEYYTDPSRKAGVAKDAKIFLQPTPDGKRFDVIAAGGSAGTAVIGSLPAEAPFKWYDQNQAIISDMRRQGGQLAKWVQAIPFVTADSVKLAETRQAAFNKSIADEMAASAELFKKTKTEGVKQVVPALTNVMVPTQETAKKPKVQPPVVPSVPMPEEMPTKARKDPLAAFKRPPLPEDAKPTVDAKGNVVFTPPPMLDQALSARN